MATVIAWGQEYGQGTQDLGSRALGRTSGWAWGSRGPSSPLFPCLLPPLPHSELKPSSCSGDRARLGQVGGWLHWAYVLSPREPAPASPCPARGRPMRCLPTVPLCPYGRRRRKAHRARGQAPALTLTLPALFPIPEAAHQAYSPIPQSLIPCCYFSGKYGCHPGLGVSLFTPSKTRILTPLPSGIASSCRKQIWSLPKKPCPLCCLLPVLPTPALPSPPLQLVFKSLGRPLGGEAHSQVPLWCHVRHFARKSHLGKDGKGQKNKNKFPLTLG